MGWVVSFSMAAATIGASFSQLGIQQAVIFEFLAISPNEKKNDDFKNQERLDIQDSSQDIPSLRRN